MTKESDILHETANLYLIQTPKGLELRLIGATHSVVVGSPKDVEAGKRAMVRMERYPDTLRAVYSHR